MLLESPRSCSVSLDRPRIDPNKPDKCGKVPLHYACTCYGDYPDVVQILLADPRIDPNEPDNDGMTPLHIACYYNQQDAVKILLTDPRIDPNEPNMDGISPRDIARLKERDEIIRLIDERRSQARSVGPGSRPLTHDEFLFASADGDLEFMRLFMNRRCCRKNRNNN